MKRIYILMLFISVAALCLAGCTKIVGSYAYINNSEYVIETMDDAEYKCKAQYG